MIQSIKLAACLALTTAVTIGCTMTPSSTSVKNTASAQMYLVTIRGSGVQIGEIHFSDSPRGLKIETDLKKLPAGPHGFHIHENASCAPAEKDGEFVAALAAGGHYNPLHAQNHGSPLTGHLGDLPLLLVETNGTAKKTLIAPRLKVADIQGQAVVIHAGGDNYSDSPNALGGGGARIACGVI